MEKIQEKIQDKFGRLRAFKGQTVQSNKMFAISNCLLGSGSQSKPAAKPSVDDDPRAKAIRERAGRFRILIIGRANAGKTTILQKVCNTTEQPEIFDSRGNKVRRCSAKDRYRAMTPINYGCSDRNISDHAYCAGMIPRFIGFDELTYS